jgi:hypothetical protein
LRSARVFDTDRSMRYALAAILFVGSITLGCGKPPKQAEAPDVMKGGDVDMAAEEVGAKPATAEELAAKEAKTKVDCCVNCLEGLSKDRSGDSPDKIPCADFTAQLNPLCLEFFRSHPIKASECK